MKDCQPLHEMLGFEATVNRLAGRCALAVGFFGLESYSMTIWM